MKKLNKFWVGISVFLVCIVFTLLCTKIDANAATSEQTYGRTYYTGYENGKYYYNLYVYPSKAQQYGIPQSCFQQEGTYHDKSYNGGYSYTVITFAKDNVFPENNRKNKYLESYFIVWTNTIVPPSLHNNNVAEGSAEIKIIYSNGLSMSPTSEPIIQMRLLSKNPDLYTSGRAEYVTREIKSLSKSTVAGMATTGIHVVSGNIYGAVLSVPSWAINILEGSKTTSGTKLSEITTGPQDYSSAQDPVRALSFWIDRNRYLCDDYDATEDNSNKTDNIVFTFKEKSPSDSSIYAPSNERKAQVRFTYEFSVNGIRATYTDTYNVTYFVNDTWGISIPAQMSDGNLWETAVSGKTYDYTGNAITPVPTVKFKENILKAGTDYTVSYSNNKEVGTGTITITGKGGYKGSVKIPFYIRPQMPRMLITVPYANDKYAGLYVFPVTGAHGYEIYRSVDGGPYIQWCTGNYNAYTESNAPAGKVYRYRVRAYRVVLGVKYYSEFSYYVQKDK